MALLSLRLNLSFLNRRNARRVASRRVASRSFSPFLAASRRVVSSFTKRILNLIFAGEGTIVSVFHLATFVRRIGVGLVSRIRVRPVGASETVAHAYAERPRAVHQDEDVPRRRQRGSQIGGEPIQDRPREADEDRRLRWPAS